MNPKKLRVPCPTCSIEPKQFGHIYCSNKCQWKHEHYRWVMKWFSGVEYIGEGTKHIKRYLIDTFGNKCSECGWAEVNERTGHVPIQLDHIVDGNSKNNRPENVRLLCPNCHSLTPTFGGLNRGNGRAWRRERYLKVAA